MTIEEIRYRLRHGPPASWIYYMVLTICEVTVIAGVQDSLMDNVSLGIAFIMAMVWQATLCGLAKFKIMVAPRFCHLYNTFKMVAYGIALGFTNSDKEHRAVWAFLIIYGITDFYTYIVAFMKLPSLRAVFTPVQPVHEIRVPDQESSLARWLQNMERERSMQTIATLPSAPAATKEDLEKGNEKADPVVTTEREQETQCVICLEEFTKKPANAKLNCGHTFHKWCIREWLSIKNTCPTCRSSGS